MTSLALIALISLGGDAQAFCGTYVGHAGTDLFSHASQVAIARQGDQTTLTMANDYQGDLSDFALLIPVPSVLSEYDVEVVENSVLQRVEVYSGPRLVEYTCEDFYSPWQPWSPSLGCQEYAMMESSADGYSGEQSKDSVTIEAEFAVGEYEIAILSAEDGEGLDGWLDVNGFELGEGAGELLQEYIDGGSYFLAARVMLDAVPDGQRWLSPLQIRYETETFSLPIRLGTLNSPGEQDLIIYTLTEMGEGRTAIQNYPMLEMESDCMLDTDDAFGQIYTDRLNELMSQEPAAWFTEYSWAPYHCDPCAAGEALSDEDVQALGFEGSAFDAFFTRLHMRYTADSAETDVALYHSGIPENTQVRFITHVQELEDLFPVCDEGMRDNPGSCEELYEQWDKERKREERLSCASAKAGPGLAGVFVLALAGVLVRRRGSA